VVVVVVEEVVVAWTRIRGTMARSGGNETR
jgi:hypothetical protein